VPARKADVFINIAFDEPHEYLFLSLIVAVVGHGFQPRCVVEIPHDQTRVRRIYDLIRSCPYSIHDLSAVGLSKRPFRVPRFNMPFELGLAVALSLSGAHRFRVMDAIPHRVGQSLSDLGGYDPFVHFATPTGTYEAIADMFSEVQDPPIADLDGFRWVYRGLRRLRDEELPDDIFRPKAFGALVVAAQALVAHRNG
jgi:hypothetical protein